MSGFKWPLTTGMMLLTVEAPTPFNSSKILVKLIISSGFNKTLKCATISLIWAVSINFGPPNFWNGIARFESSISRLYDILAFLVKTQISERLISSSNNSKIFWHIKSASICVSFAHINAGICGETISENNFFVYFSLALSIISFVNFKIFWVLL